MDSHGIRYTVIKDNIVGVTYTGSNCPSINVIVMFDKLGNNYVEFASYSIGSVNSDEKYANAIVLCNQFNKEYRWVKLFVDDERTVVAKADAIVDFSSVGAECSEMVNRMVNLIDEAYPGFMKLMWA